MPYPQFHSCKIRPVDEFQPKSFRVYTENQPEGQSLIIARPKGKTTTATQSIRFDKDVWTEERAKAYCDEKGGTFETASPEAEAVQYEAATWQDIIGLEESGLSHNDKRERVQAALREHLGFWEGKYGPYIRDLWDDSVIYEGGDDGKYWRASYSFDDRGKVKIGESKEVVVQTTYTDVLEAVRLGEAATIKAMVQGFLRQADAMLGKKDLPAAVKAHLQNMRVTLNKTWTELTKGEPEPDATEEAQDIDLSGDFIALVEALQEGSEIVPIKIIAPGWGSSGYYGAEVLEKAASIYKAGTQMYWDHPTMTEEKDRPERTIRDLAGVLMSDGAWEPGGSAGPGIYAKAKVFGPYKDAVTELAPHIGISHRAVGRAKKGEAEGKKGDIIEQITAARSVDFVTVPGAGGQVLQLFEAAREQGAPIQTEKEDIDMTEAEKAVLEKRVTDAEAEVTTLTAANKDLTTEVARHNEGMLFLEATALVVAELKEAQIPDMTRQRLIDTLGVNPPVKDGKLDVETFKESIKKALADEVEYLNTVTSSGKIRGMGNSKGGSTRTMKEAFKEQALSDGKTEDEAEKFATDATEGR